jgi:hypothetical protein
VETKAEFNGLFNPFGKKLILSAYAAAKPFGGRIGPMLFDISDGTTVKSRSNQLSSAYISGLKIESFTDSKGRDVPEGTYSAGMPVPINTGGDAGRFWLKSQLDPVGGILGDESVFFGIPNILWDYKDGDTTDRQAYVAADSTNVQELSLASIAATTPSAGLYNASIFRAFKRKLVGIDTRSVSRDSINNALIIIRAPTLYETHNYLIPTPEDLNKSLLTDSWGIISGPPDTARTITDADSVNYKVYDFKIYAPIFDPNPSEAIYSGPEVLTTVLADYLAKQNPALEKFRASMNIVAANIFNNNKSAATGDNTGREAAALISDLPETTYASIGSKIAGAEDAPPSCASITGKFLNFYGGAPADLVTTANPCGTSLAELMRSRWSSGALTGAIYQEFSYALPEGMTTQLFTAYRPGPRHDAGQADGIVKSAISKSPDTMIRNFYSAKFIPMKSLMLSSNAAYGQGTMPIYSEGETSETNSDNETQRNIFRNPIEPGNLSRDIQDLHH